MNSDTQKMDEKSLEWIWERTLDMEGSWNAYHPKNRVWRALTRRRMVRRLWFGVTSAAALLAIGLWLAWIATPPPPEAPVLQYASTPGIQLSVDDALIAELPAESHLQGTEQLLQVLDEQDSLAYRIEVRPQQYATLTVPPGHRYSLTLSDGSRVTLNADSRLTYAVEFTDSVRAVQLSGEALFEITPDARRPFCVTTPHGVHTQVLGTRFNVMAYPEMDCTVTLLNGSVRVMNEADTCRLYPGQQARCREMGVDVKWVDTKMATGWLHNCISCNNEPLSQLVGKISRQYEAEVYIGDPTIEDVTFYGYLPNSLTLDEVFKVLYQSEGIRVKHSEAGYMLYQ